MSSTRLIFLFLLPLGGGGEITTSQPSAGNPINETELPKMTTSSGDSLHSLEVYNVTSLKLNLNTTLRANILRGLHDFTPLRPKLTPGHSLLGNIEYMVFNTSFTAYVARKTCYRKQEYLFMPRNSEEYEFTKEFISEQDLDISFTYSESHRDSVLVVKFTQPTWIKDLYEQTLQTQEIRAARMELI